jgi:glycosyltransferase involved in cell wall biosynthesis
MFCLARYLRQHRPSALLSSLEYSNLNAILAREISGMNLSVILTIQNTLGRHSESDQFERLVVFATKGLFRLADCVVAVSHGVAEDLAKIAPGARRLIRVIYNPVVGPNLYSRSLEKPGHSWLLDGGPPVFLGVGRLVPQKDFSTLLRAFKRVRNQIPARLLILGEGPLRGELESLASELGIREDVSMPGIDANPFPYFRRAPVFVLSSAWEGLANVLIEALALGARVVSTDCPSGPREILEGGRWGSLVRVGDDAAMAQAMLLSLKQPRRDSAEAGLAVGRFRVETVVQEFKKILPSLQPRGEREC